MRAWLMDSAEGVERLRLGEVEDPRPGPTEVLLKMRVAALNPADAFLARGMYPAKPPLPHILGRDGVGDVVTVGPGWRNSLISSRSMSSPFISGITMSVMTKSAGLWRYNSSPSRPLTASVTSYPAASRSERRSTRMIASSSMTRMETIALPQGVRSRFGPCMAYTHRGSHGQVKSGRSSDDGPCSKIEFVILIVRHTTWECQDLLVLSQAILFDHEGVDTTAIHTTPTVLEVVFHHMTPAA